MSLHKFNVTRVLLHSCLRVLKTLYYGTSFVSSSTQVATTPLTAKVHLSHQNIVLDCILISLLYFVSSDAIAVTRNLLRDVIMAQGNG